MEKVKEFLRSLSAFLAAAKMFPIEHPQARNIADAAYAHLQDILAKKEELIIGIVDEEIIFDNQILFDLSALMQVFISHTKKRGIEKIYFRRGLQKAELMQFIGFLASKKESSENIQEHFYLLGITNIKVSKLTTPMEQQKKEKVTQPQAYENLVEQFLNLYEKILNQKKDSANIYLELKFIVFHLIENLSGRYQEYFYALPLGTYKKTVLHSLNVALLATYFSSKLGFLHEDTLEIGVAALLHDIGKMSVLSKDDVESPVEGNLAGLSAMLGAKMLLRYEKEFGVLPVIVSYEHHLRYDLKDASLPVPQQQHLASLIISICDCYDMYNQQKDPQINYSPDRIYQLMVNENQGLFQPQLVEKFFKVIGIWPVGTILLLNNGGVAIVREQNENDIFCPKIEIVSAQEGTKFIDLREVKKEITIVQTINPFEEGKKYVDLI